MLFYKKDDKHLGIGKPGSCCFVLFFLIYRLSHRCGAMQRLYVGGLSHTVTQKDLKDRFGKFGDVQDVELRTRRDEEGKESFNVDNI